MTSFSSTAAAIEGFTVLRRAPVTFAVAAIAYAVPFTFVQRKLAYAAVPIRTAQEALPTQPSPEEVLAYVQTVSDLQNAAMMPWGLLLAVLSLFIAAAFLRVFVRGVVGGWIAGYQVGLDELRVLVVLVLTTLVLMGVGIGAGLAAILIASVLAATLGAIGAALSVFVVLAALGLLIFVSVRLSPAMAAAIDQRRFLTLGAAWSSVRGRFWPAFGAYVLTLIMGLLASLVVGTGMWVLASLFFGADAWSVRAGAAAPDVMDQVLNSPAFLAGAAAMAVAQLAVTAAQLGVGAYIWRTRPDAVAAATFEDDT